MRETVSVTNWKGNFLIRYYYSFSSIIFIPSFLPSLDLERTLVQGWAFSLLANVIEISHEGHGFDCNPLAFGGSVDLPVGQLAADSDVETGRISELQVSSSFKQTVIGFQWTHS